MAQIMAIRGSRSTTKMAKIIQQATKKANTIFILLSKAKTKTMRKAIISPLVKKWSSSWFIFSIILWWK